MNKPDLVGSMKYECILPEQQTFVKEKLIAVLEAVEETNYMQHTKAKLDREMLT